jgi:peptide/nickel transport system permease protein
MFFLTRLASSVLVMALVALLTFMVIDLAPGSYLDDLKTNPQVSSEMLARLRAQYGLDRPFYGKFWQWSRSLASGDLGYSLVYQRPVRQLIAERLRNTVLLNLTALALAWIAGTALGLTAAAARGSLADLAIGGATAVMISTPSVALAVVLLALAARLGLPIGGASMAGAETLTAWARIADQIRHLALPVFAVAAVWLPAITRHTRTAVLAAMDAPHMLAAKARGVGRARLLLVHALREALVPLTNFFGLSVAGLVSASLVVEVVMSWPGIGALTYDAVLKRDIFLVVDLMQLSAMLLLIGNAVGDVLLHAVDPRTAGA